MAAGETRVYRSGAWQRRSRNPVYPPLDDGFVLGVTQPDAINTGPRITEASMTTVTGTITLNTPQTYENRIVEGTIVITSSNVIVRNCIIRMPSSGTAIRGVFCATAGATNILIEYVRIEVPAGNRSYNQGYCIQGSGYTARRCDFSGTVDGLSIAGVNQRASVTVEGCYIHDLPVYTAGSPGIVHPTDTVTHNDGMQIEGNLSSVSIIGNSICTARTSCILVTQDNGTYDVAPHIEDNWFFIDDPTFGSMLNISKTGMTLPDLTVKRNRFPLGNSPARLFIIDAYLTSMTASGGITSHGTDHNMYDDLSYPVRVWNGSSNLTTYGAN